MSSTGKPPALRPAHHQTSANNPRNGDINLNGSLPIPRSAGKSKRTLIENACAACRRRKSRVGAASLIQHSRRVRLTQLRSAVASVRPAHAARRSKLVASTKPKKARVAGLRYDDATKS